MTMFDGFTLLKLLKRYQLYKKNHIAVDVKLCTCILDSEGGNYVFGSIGFIRSIFPRSLKGVKIHLY